MTIFYEAADDSRTCADRTHIMRLMTLAVHIIKSCIDCLHGQCEMSLDSIGFPTWKPTGNDHFQRRIVTRRADR